jgi:hypothetical protein
MASFQTELKRATDYVEARIDNLEEKIKEMVARVCAGAQVNIRHIYATSLGREAMCYIAVDDIEKAKKALK